MNPETLKRRYQREDEQAIDEAVLALFKHEQGRKFIWWVLQIGRVGLQPFTNNALTTSFNCGALDVGQQFLDRVLTVSPDGYVNLMKEMADARRKRDAELGAASRTASDGTGADDSTDGAAG